ncbi:MAG TPA: HD domain-containing phosphohydrolase [Limnochordales bacterium]
MEPPQPAITIGIALWPHDGRKLQTLIGKADQRMYQHKRRQVAQALTSKGKAQGRLPGGFFEGWLINSPDGIIITDPDMQILYVNPAYERRAGYTLRELVGKRPNFIGLSTGYPDGLAGEEIPLEARIVAIADVYDALRSERPYKPSWSHQQAVEQIRTGRGQAFDPALVEVFLAVADSFAQVWDRMNDDSKFVAGG